MEEKTMTYEEAKDALYDMALDSRGTPCLLNLDWLYEAGFDDDEIIDMCFEIGRKLEEEGYDIEYNYPIRKDEWGYYVFTIVYTPREKEAIERLYNQIVSTGRIPSIKEIQKDPEWKWFYREADYIEDRALNMLFEALNEITKQGYEIEYDDVYRENGGWLIDD